MREVVTATRPNSYLSPLMRRCNIWTDGCLVFDADGEALPAGYRFGGDHLEGHAPSFSRYNLLGARGNQLGNE